MILLISFSNQLLLFFDCFLNNFVEEFFLISR